MEGPCKVLSAHPSDDQHPVTYSIIDLYQPTARPKPKRLHYNRLKPYVSPLPPTPPAHTTVTTSPTLTALSGSLPLATPPVSPAPFLPLPEPSQSHPQQLNLRPTPRFPIPQSPTSGSNALPPQRTRSGRVVSRPRRLGFPDDSCY